MGHLRRLGAAAATTAIIGSGITAGTASASIFHNGPGGGFQTSAAPCTGISPNVIDLPYFGRIFVSQSNPLRSGYADIRIDANMSVWGYTNLIDVRWRNLGTGKTGQLRGQLGVRLSDGGTMKTFEGVNTGPGRVRIEFRPTNRGALLTTPATSQCSDVFTVR